MNFAAELPWTPPDEAFLCLGGAGTAFLDSAAVGDKRAQISYLCIDPYASLTLGESPYAELRDFLARHRPLQAAASAWPFAFKGGAVGWIGYDAARQAIGVSSQFSAMPGLPGGWFALHNIILGFDHPAQRLYYLGPEGGLAEIGSRLAQRPALPGLPALQWVPEMDRATYLATHERLRGYIEAGDVYQANLTLRFAAARPPEASLAGLHMALRALSPAPFAACIDAGGFGLASASPERFMRLQADGQVETRPIKGTAAREPGAAADAAAAQALVENPKERAENLMITDLLRHDLGQVCSIGSIAVPEFCVVESFAQAHHLVSCVTGRLKPGLDALDLLAATLPGGSITGAPKRRAMEIIDGLELGPRGAYCGVVAWIGFDGAMDSAIIIRTVTAAADTLYAQSGGGITWDSFGPAEYEEAMIKIAPLLALGND